MWRLKNKPQTKQVTKHLAKLFVEMTPAPRDREVSERRLMVYRKILAKGEFRPVTWAMAHCAETQETYRINGKHTSLLIYEQDVIPDFFVTLEEYECDTLEDVAKLYATFDSRIASRTSNEINRQFAASIPDLDGVPSKIVNLAVSSIAYSKFGLVYAAVPPPERAEALFDHYDFVIWLNEMLCRDAKIHRHFSRAPIAAVMFESYIKAKKVCEEFWTEARDETNPDPTAPSRRLSRFLLQHSGKGPILTRHKIDAREFYVKAVLAWNAWRKGGSTDLKYYKGGTPPKVT